MKILYRSVAKNGPGDAVAKIEASRLFTAGTKKERLSKPYNHH